MTISELIRTNPGLGDLEIAALHSASPDRYAPLVLTLLGLGAALASAGVDPEQAEGLSDRLILDLQSTARENPTRLAVFAPLTTGDSVDFANPLIRSRLPAVIQSPGPFTVQDFRAVASLLTDLHGGDTTEQQVAAVRAEVALGDATARVDSYRSSADAAIAGLSAAERGSWAAVRDAWVAAGDAAATGESA